jgi:hypothetical protein
MASGRVILQAHLQGRIGRSSVPLPDVERWERRGCAASLRRLDLAHVTEAAGRGYRVKR